MATISGGVDFKSRAHTLPTKESSHASYHETSEVEGCLWQDKDSSYESDHEASELDLPQESLATHADSRSINTIRGLVLDCCQQWKIGHGGKCTVSMSTFKILIMRRKRAWNGCCCDCPLEIFFTRGSCHA